VSRDSAKIDYAKENTGTIPADHVGMSKFSSKDDTGYKRVLHAIEGILQEMEGT
jgi:hypothetical protein